MKAKAARSRSWRLRNARSAIVRALFLSLELPVLRFFMAMR
jgi:hypothetical protein